MKHAATVTIVTPKRSAASLLDGDDASPPPASLPATVDIETLADLLNISSRMVSDYARRGVITRQTHGQYVLRESVKSFVAHVHKKADHDMLTAERIRQTKAQADLLDLKNAKAKSELLDAAEVEREWASVLRDLRAALLAVPSRVGSRLPSLTAHDIGEIAREIKDALSELAHGND